MVELVETPTRRARLHLSQKVSMFLLFGTRLSQTIINTVMMLCGYCNTRAAQNVVKQSNRFTLFFIPLFSFSTRYVNVCTNCGGQTALTTQQAQYSLEWAEAHR